MRNALHAAMFSGLIDQCGGVEAAAATVRDLTGEEASIGTLSKIRNGAASVPLAWAFALEDQTGNHCFTSWRRRMLKERGEGERISTIEHVASVQKETSEAVAALVGLARGKGDKAETLRELIEARAVIDQAMSEVEAQIGAGILSMRRGA